MDGNRRWAKLHNQSSFQGHYEGEKRIEPIIDKAIELGIGYLTFWAFSTENWKRTKTEVNFLLTLFRQVLTRRIDNFHKKNVRLNVLGDLSQFPVDIQKSVTGWMKKTKNNSKITVNLALNYGGRGEIVRAIKRIYNSTPKGGQAEFIIQNLTKENFGQYLDTGGQPDPDLMIRTGGESRLSGFLLWQMEYAELYFTSILWPDFTPEEFDKAVSEYQRRKRNFGK